MIVSLCVSWHETAHVLLSSAVAVALVLFELRASGMRLGVACAARWSYRGSFNDGLRVLCYAIGQEILTATRESVTQCVCCNRDIVCAS